MAEPIASYDGMDRARFRAEILPDGRPAVFRGIARDWPAVRAGEGTAAYLRALDRGAPCDRLEGPPEEGGRLFYTADLQALNFTRTRSTPGAVIDALVAAAPLDHPPTIAAQAVPAADLPGFAEANRLAIVPDGVSPRLWIGNRVVTATHHDQQTNVAVVVAGRRRFTVFPPEAAAHLHLGPLEFTPAGTPVSLVDPEAPDLARFPRFAAALPTKQVAELAPGDAIFIPYLWWHHVRSLDTFSVLANYWWNEAEPAQPGLAPVDALVHALLAFSALPADQKAAWRPLFDHLVFADSDDLAAVPPARRGLRGPIGPEVRQRLRRQLGALMAGDPRPSGRS